MSFDKVLSIVSDGASSCLLALFQVVGFINFPLSLHRTSGVTVGAHRWSTFIWWFIQLVLAVINGILAKINYNCLFFGLLLTDAMNNYFKFGIGLVTVFVTLADSWLGVETHRSIWMRYRDMASRHGRFLGLLDVKETARLVIRFAIIFLFVAAICVVVEYKVYFGVATGTQWFCFWTHNLFPYTISRLRHMFHLLHIMLLVGNLRQLRSRLKRAVVNSVEDTLENMEECRELYGEIWQVNEGVNELFGFSQALNIACSFVQIAFDLYWVYAMWMVEEDNIDLQIYCLVSTPVIVGFLMQAANDHHLAVEDLKETLFDINCIQDKRMLELRLHFLTQLYRNRLRLTARNIFDFDFTLIRKLAIVIVTYIVIFVEISR